MIITWQGFGSRVDFFLVILIFTGCTPVGGSARRNSATGYGDSSSAPNSAR
jgi:hypothetical protein